MITISGAPVDGTVSGLAGNDTIRVTGTSGSTGTAGGSLGAGGVGNSGTVVGGGGTDTIAINNGLIGVNGINGVAGGATLICIC